MRPRTIKALVEPDPENPEQILILSPGVGLFRPSLPKGAFITPDLRMGVISRLQRYYNLMVPQGARGAVIEQLVDDGVNCVQYRTPLLRIGTATAEQMEAAGTGAAAGPGGAAEGQITVRSPTDGIFYRRPDPQSPAYVEVGQVVETGAQLGLVEVMKCFNQIRLDDEGLPSRCRVVAINAEDAGEVALGQVLFVLEAAG